MKRLPCLIPDRKALWATDYAVRFVADCLFNLGGWVSAVRYIDNHLWWDRDLKAWVLGLAVTQRDLVEATVARNRVEQETRLLAGMEQELGASCGAAARCA